MGYFTTRTKVVGLTFLPLFAATKEAAYVHALSLAAIAHSVAKVCAVGDVTSCSCDTERLELPATDSERRYAMGCSDNVGFGLNFAAQFLRLRHSITTADSLQEGATDAQWREVFLHNLRTAAEVRLNFADNQLNSCR